MARRKADYDNLIIQEFLNKAQAMAYTNCKTEEKFDELIHPYVHTYQSSQGVDYYVPELRKRKLAMVEKNCKPEFFQLAVFLFAGVYRPRELQMGSRSTCSPVVAALSRARA